MDTITIEDFKKLEIKIGTVKSVERIENADKLLKLIFDIGNGEERQILAGIAEFYPDIESLVGTQVPLLLNLEPRKMRGLMSEGMMLAVDDGEGAILLHPDKKIPSGSIVR